MSTNDIVFLSVVPFVAGFLLRQAFISFSEVREYHRKKREADIEHIMDRVRNLERHVPGCIPPSKDD
jgi:hypothetical protein